MIYCKRVYDPASDQDGYRVLVDRLWPRGIKKTDLACEEWCQKLAPSTTLRKAFHAETIDFPAFKDAYLAELDAQKEEGLRLSALSKHQTVTLLFAARNSQQNHAQVLAEWLSLL